MRRTLSNGLLLGLLLLASVTAPTAAQICPGPSPWAPAKGNYLYLYFPTTSDATFPDYSVYGASTSPADPFDVADLDASIGTTAQLRQRIFDLVRFDYCEFDVEVSQTTTAPSPTEARWQIVAIGSDEDGLGGSLGGEAQDVDTGDDTAQDYARVWAGSFKLAFGGTGGPLAGSDSTLERWANTIAGTTAHEAGHNYGLSHGNENPVAGSGEDAATNHLMDSPSGEVRASVNRHFSDTSYQILGHNLGLNWDTLHNWDFVNPNSADAHALTVTVLSQATTLSINWHYTGSRTPWVSPTVTATGGTATLHGVTYNVFDVDFSVDHAWTGGADGVAPPGVEFHVGAGFSGPDPVIVYETSLQDNGGSDLPLAPRVIGYDTGAADLLTGDFLMTFVNPDPGDGPLILEDLTISYLPRMADIETMVAGAALADLRGLPINFLAPPRIPVQDDRQQPGDRLGVAGARVDVVGNRVVHAAPIEVRDRVVARIAGLASRRHVDITYDATDCEPKIVGGGGPFDALFGELEYCPDGPALSLFPATSVYVTATLLDPDARHFDAAEGRIVEGPLRTRIFFQAAGFVPDFNDNGEDDLLDIRNGTSRDDNGNGVPDEAEGGRGRGWSLHAGVAEPRGPLANRVDSGWTLNLDRVWPLGRRWAWDLRLGLSRFDGKPGEEDLDIWNLGANLKYTLAPGAVLRPFVNAGGGLYYLDPGDLEGGYALGGGVAATVTGGVTAELTYNHHWVLTGSPDLEYDQVQLGLIVSF